MHQRFEVLLAFDLDRPQTFNALLLFLRRAVVVAFVWIGFGHPERQHVDRHQLEGALGLKFVGDFGEEGVLGAGFFVGVGLEGAEGAFDCDIEG